MNALAGGGSFVSLPALIAAGLPSVQANASSTVALLPGSVASAWAYRDGLGPVGAVSSCAPSRSRRYRAERSARFACLISTPTSTFNFSSCHGCCCSLPWRWGLAGKFQGPGLGRRWRIGPAAVLAIQFGLGVYGGYFGGAVGIMMMAVWGLMGHHDLKRLNAPRTLLVSSANTVAVLVFIVAGAVHWPETVVMLIAAALGGYGGAQIGRRARPNVVRAGTLCLTACITLGFFLPAYLPDPRW